MKVYFIYQVQYLSASAHIFSHIFLYLRKKIRLCFAIKIRTFGKQSYSTFVHQLHFASLDRSFVLPFGCALIDLFSWLSHVRLLFSSLISLEVCDSALYFFQHPPSVFTTKQNRACLRYFILSTTKLAISDALRPIFPRRGGVGPRPRFEVDVLLVVIVVNPAASLPC